MTNMKMKAIARKELSRIENEDKEVITNEIVRFDFDEKIMNYLETIFDDYEYGQNHGVYQNEDGEICIIDVDMLLDEMHDMIADDESKDKEETATEKTISEYFEKFKGFNINV